MNMIEITDEELCMLEQLTYLSEKVAQVASNHGEKFKVDFYRINENNKQNTISQILKPFTPEALDNLRLHIEAIDNSEISGLEWANIIEYLQNSSNRPITYHS